MKTTIYYCLFLSLFSMVCYGQAALNPDYDDLDFLISENSGDRGDGGDNGGVDKTGDGSGGGEAIIKIGLNIDWPDEGRMVAKTNTLSWKGLNDMDSGPYQVIIRTGTDKMASIIYSALVESKSIDLPLGQLAMKPEANYSVQVTSMGGDTQYSSKSARFSIVAPSFYNEVIAQAKSNDKFAKASRLKKILMKAWALQANGLHHAAHQKYKLYVETDKDDITLRNIRDAFRAEVGISCLCK